jgi:hypothetical protein
MTSSKQYIFFKQLWVLKRYFSEISTEVHCETLNVNIKTLWKFEIKTSMVDV